MKHLFLAAVGVLAVIAQPAYAQKNGGPATDGLCGMGGEPGEPIALPDPPPPVPSKLATSPGGVDMQSGSFTYRNTDISIGGEGDAGLSLTRSFSYAGASNLNEQPMGLFFTNDWQIQLRETRSAVPGACYPDEFDYNVVIAYGDLGEGFRSAAVPNSFSQTAPRGYATLTRTSTLYTFVARDGTTVKFPTPYGCSGYSAITRCSYASEVKRPDGTIYTLGSDSAGRNVVSNRGYALILEYSGYNKIGKVCALNLATATMPSTNTCPSGVPTATYSYTGTDMTSATEASGGTWSYGHNATAGTFDITRPGDSTPYVTNTYTLFKGVLEQDYNMRIASQSFAAGTGYTYTWDELINYDQTGYDTRQTMGGKWTDANGDYAKVTYGQYQAFSSGGTDPTLKATPGPISVRDPLGNVTTADYCGSIAQGAMCAIPPLRSITSPEGNREEYAYGAFNNVTTVTKKAKPGSTLSDIVDTKTYPSAYPGNPVLRAKPQTVTDANGNTTTYTYDSTHGGVTSETGPAVQVNGTGSAIAPIKRYDYTLRKAWLDNGAGGFVQSATGVWLITTEKTCLTSATSGITISDTCAGGSADEVITTYDYGPDTGLVGNTLLLRGLTVTAADHSGSIVSRRTCFGYDAKGNKIWETTPRAGLTVCN